MKMLFKNIIFLLLVSSFHGSLCQSNVSYLENYFHEIRIGNYPTIHDEILKSLDSSEGLSLIAGYYNDSSAIVRSNAYTITYNVGSKSVHKDVRSKAIQNLIDACNDPESGNIYGLLDYLTKFRREDFIQNEKAKEKIRLLLLSNPAHIDKLFKLIGFFELNLEAAILPYTQPGINAANRWAAIVSLARMNDVLSLQDMMTRVQKLPINDDVVQTIFPDLVYTRQKPALDYLVQVMNSNEKNCTSANPNSDEKIVCGYRIMEMLAPAIEGYPLELDASGDIKTDNYEEALATVRAWFENNKDYKINRDTF